MKLQDENSAKLEEVSSQFNLGEIEEFSKLEGGLVNISFLVETSKGKFVLQKLSRIWDARVIDDYLAVQSYLRTNGLNVPVLLQSRDNAHHYRLNGDIWRAFEYTPNDNITESTLETVYEAGKMLGKFHLLMSTSRFKPTFQLQGFHDTPKIIGKLESFLSSSEYKKKADTVQEHARFLLSETPKFYLPSDAKKTIIHGDPKMANFLFYNGRAVSLLDLDTMMSAPAEIDIGDAFRSWCRRKPSTSDFKKDIFEKGIQGYNEGNSKDKISPQKVKETMALITLELAARYLNDHFEENYFALSPKYSNRAVQGLARSQRYTQYFRNFWNDNI